MPSSRAIARAVSGWSPVIITIRIPARRHLATASRASARGGSCRPIKPRKVIPLSVCVGAERLCIEIRQRSERPLGEGQHAQCVVRHDCAGLQHSRPIAFGQWLGASLGQRCGSIGRGSSRAHPSRRHEPDRPAPEPPSSAFGRSRRAPRRSSELSASNASRRMPCFAAATRSDPSVGSPTMPSRPACPVNSASLHATAARRSLPSSGSLPAGTSRPSAKNAPVTA